MRMNIYGLKCDAPTCDYNDPTVKLEEYEANIGKPCPKCGESLLTQEAFDRVMEIKTAAEGDLVTQTAMLLSIMSQLPHEALLDLAHSTTDMLKANPELLAQMVVDVDSMGKALSAEVKELGTDGRKD